ncbi:sensor histidine kinase [Chloroflexota bacterium]
MPQFSLRLRIYIGFIAVSGVALLVYLLFRGFPDLSLQNSLLAATFALFIGIAGIYPIPISMKTKAYVTTAAIFAALLLFDPVIATLVAVTGAAFSQIFIRRGWYNTLFNVGQTILYVGLASLTYNALTGGLTAMTFTSFGSVVALPVAAGIAYLVNSCAVAAAAGLQIKQNPIKIWLRGSREASIQELALFAFGFLCALAIHQVPWAIVLMVIPVVIIYYSFKRLVLLNEMVKTQMDELKATQAQLVQSARMASIGTMMMGISHQINNPIFIIKGRAETLLSSAEQYVKSKKGRQHLEIIFNMADRVGRVVNSLLPSSRPSEDGKPCTDVNEVLENVITLLEPKIIHSNVRLYRRYDEKLHFVSGDATEIQELFTNLVDNACDAMPHGGELVLTTSVKDSLVVAEVTDSGVGIPQENLENIFSPFFTTKKVGQGVGLGLYVAKQIAQKYGGTISVRSECGRGTTFSVFLSSGVRPVQSTDREAMAVASGSGNRLPSQ